MRDRPRGRGPWGGRRRRIAGGGATSCQRGVHRVEEPAVQVELRHVPHHGATEAGELFVELDDGVELARGDVAPAGAGAGRHAHQDLDVGVLGGLLGPRVPDVEVVGVLGGVGPEVDHAAPVVVELDHDEVERHRPAQHVVHGRVRVHALRRRREVHRLARAVHVRPELVGERGEVLRARLEVVVEAVDDGGAEGPVGCRCVGAEEVPYLVGCLF